MDRTDSRSLWGYLKLLSPYNKGWPDFCSFNLIKSITKKVLIYLKRSNPSAIQKTQVMQVRSLGREDPLEEEMATYSSILAWEIPWTEDPGGLQSTGWQRVRHSWSNWACMRIHTWSLGDSSCPWLTFWSPHMVFYPQWVKQVCPCLPFD